MQCKQYQAWISEQQCRINRIHAETAYIAVKAGTEAPDVPELFMDRMLHCMHCEQCTSIDPAKVDKWLHLNMIRYIDRIYKELTRPADYRERIERQMIADRKYIKKKRERRKVIVDGREIVLPKLYKYIKRKRR